MANTGDIPNNITFSAGQVIRRNASDNGFEAFIPSGSGDVTGGASSTSGNFASFNGTTGKVIQDSGSKASDFATAGHTHGSSLTLSQVYPIGSIYTEVTGTNPATTFGMGTWVSFGAGRVLVGLDSGDTSFDVVEETGGAKTSTPSAHTGTAVADHSAHTHSVTSNVAVADHAANTTGQASAGATQRGTTTSTLTLSTHTHTTPALTHTVTNNAVTSGNPSATLTHSVTQPSDHSAMNIVQPYIVVYFWKRTA